MSNRPVLEDKSKSIIIVRPVHKRLCDRVRCTTFPAPGSSGTQTRNRRKTCRLVVLLRVCRNTNKELREPSPFPTTPLTAVLSLRTVGTAAACGSDNTFLKPVEHSVVHEDCRHTHSDQNCYSQNCGCSAGHGHRPVYAATCQEIQNCGRAASNSH